jgi:hypothetical protein
MAERRINRPDSAAWQAAREWQARAQGTSSSGGGFKLLLNCLMFGVVLLGGALVGLFLLILGWFMLPLARQRMKKRAERMRAQQAREVGPHFTYSPAPASSRHDASDILEGDYQPRE